jgi:hypothetical protein
MGAFNEWARDSFLAPVENRRVVPIAFNLLYGAAVLGRISALRAQGVVLPDAASQVRPLPVEEILERIS